MFSCLGKQGRRRRIQGKFLWKVSGRNNLIKSPYQSGNSDKGKVTRHSAKLRGCAYYNILIPLRQQRKGTNKMISVMDVLTIFISGFMVAKVCDYIKELDKENER